MTSLLVALALIAFIAIVVSIPSSSLSPSSVTFAQSETIKEAVETVKRVASLPPEEKNVIFEDELSNITVQYPTHWLREGTDIEASVEDEYLSIPIILEVFPQEFIAERNPPVRVRLRATELGPDITTTRT